MVEEVKLHKKGGYGFADFVSHVAAVRAICAQATHLLHGRVLKCSWGKNAKHKRKLAASMGECAMPAMALAPPPPPPPLPPPAPSREGISRNVKVGSIQTAGGWHTCDNGPTLWRRK